MKDLNRNVKFHYQYRDAGNYRQFGSVVFSNQAAISLETIERQIKSRLIDGEFFEPIKWNIPLIYHNAYDPELDHEWYLFEKVVTVNEEPTDRRNIKDFLSEISNKDF